MFHCDYAMVSHHITMQHGDMDMDMDVCILKNVFSIGLPK